MQCRPRIGDNGHGRSPGLRRIDGLDREIRRQKPGILGDSQRHLIGFCHQLRLLRRVIQPPLRAIQSTVHGHVTRLHLDGLGQRLSADVDRLAVPRTQRSTERRKRLVLGACPVRRSEAARHEHPAPGGDVLVVGARHALHRSAAGPTSAGGAAGTAGTPRALVEARQGDVVRAVVQRVHEAPGGRQQDAARHHCQPEDTFDVVLHEELQAEVH